MIPSTPTLENAILLAAMCVVLARCLCVVPKLSRKNWTGYHSHFFALAGAYALLAGGSVGTALGWHYGPLILLCGVAGGVLFDRRKPR